MTIKLKTETQARFIASIKRYFAENLDDDIGDLKASLLLEFVMREMGPTIYNQAVADAQLRVQDMISELDTACYESDLGHWNKR
jgi:uncharacterized protein (DUF2164 family)